MKLLTFFSLVLCTLSMQAQSITITPANDLTHFSCGKKAVSPPINWKHKLSNVISYGMMVESIDKGGKKIHMIAYNIPGKQFRIPAGLRKHSPFGNKVKFGKTSIGKETYFPYCKKSENEKVSVSIRLIALNAMLPAKDGLSAKEFKALCKKHSVGEGTYTFDL